MSLKTIVKIVLSVSILAVLFWRMDFAQLQNLIAHIEASAWVYAFLLIVGQFMFLSYRWMVLINIGRARMTFLNSLHVTLMSLVAGTVFLTSLTGIVVRIAMAIQHGASLFKAFFATAIDRGMTLMALVVLSILFLPALGHYLDETMHTHISAYLTFFVVLIFVLGPLLLFILFRNIEHLPFSPHNIRSGARYLKILLSQPIIAFKVITTSLLGQMCFFLSIYCLTLSANIDLSFLDLMTVLPIIALVASLPLSFGGWGVREGAFVYGLGLLGVPMEEAFLISIQTGLISLFGTIVAGIPAIFLTDIDNISQHSKHVFASLKNRTR